MAAAPPLDILAHLPPDVLLDIAERAAGLARARLAAAEVGAVVTSWSAAPRRSILTDAEGDILHLCSDGSWSVKGVPAAGDPDVSPVTGPWTVLELDVPDARAL